MKRIFVILGIVAMLGMTGCSEKLREVDSTPEKLDGSSSHEFEADDIEQAESASEEIAEYCDGAVSEAQYVGCLSHVTEEDIGTVSQQDERAWYEDSPDETPWYEK